jgi:hypothetical protein
MRAKELLMPTLTKEAQICACGRLMHLIKEVADGMNIYGEDATKASLTQVWRRIDTFINSRYPTEQ